MMLAIALNERGCSPAATVHPPTRSTGAAAEEATPHQGTTRTTTTIGASGLRSSSRPVGSRVPEGRIDLVAARAPRRISADTALRLARFFGTSERFWINLQARYDLETEKDRLGDVLDEIRPLSGAI